MPIERKLATIMFTDIAGYTEQMSKDEDKAFTLIKKKRDLLLPLLEKHEGKLIKEMGDGTLTRYFNADNAVDCASTFQSNTDTDLNVRAGIHTGEVIVDKEDVFGDVVNVASRLESIAAPGSVLISKETIDKLEMSDALELVSLGMQSLKGVGRLIKVYAIKDESLVVPNPEDYSENKIKVHSDDEVPSIAIIPFENKGAEEDIFYAYGISADLISDCSGAGLIRVAGLKDIEKLDYANLKYEELSEKLLVRYIAQGTLWKMGEMFQLSVELYDTKDKKVVWSDRWQEKWDNLSTIKGSLSDGLLKALDTKPKVEPKVATTNPEAYEFYLKAKHKHEKRQNKDDIKIARELLNKALELDDNLLLAKYELGKTYSLMGDFDRAIDIEALALKQAQILNDFKMIAHFNLSIAFSYLKKGKLKQTLDYNEHSLKIFKKINDKRGIAGCYNLFATVYWTKGEWSKALENNEKQINICNELNDIDELIFATMTKSTIYGAKHDFCKSIQYNNIAIKYYEKENNEQSLAFCYNNNSKNYFEIGEIENSYSFACKAYEICQRLNLNSLTPLPLIGIGRYHFSNQNFDIALEHFTQSLTIQKETKLDTHHISLLTNTYSALCNKKLGKKYDDSIIKQLIDKTPYIPYYIHYLIYKLIEDQSNLETAFNQVQDQKSAMEKELAEKFLNYPIPKQIVEEWEKLNK